MIQNLTEEPNRRTQLKGGLFSIAGMAGMPSLARAVQDATTPYRRPKLKITDIRTAEVRVHGYQVHVRVYTDQGVIGQGESTDAAMGNVPLINSFSRMLIGQDPLNIEAAFERIRTSGIFAGAQSGQYVAALTAVEIALWDLTAIPARGKWFPATKDPKRESERSSRWASLPLRSISTTRSIPPASTA